MSFELQLKTLDSGSFKVVVEPDLKISELKTRIMELKGEKYNATHQQLIHNGKILQDTASIGELGIQPTDFVVCMVSKKKVQGGAAPPVAAAAPTRPVAAAAPVVAPSQPASAQNLAEEMPADPVLVAQLQAMGFPKDQAEAALRAAFNNADLAAEFLMTGMGTGELQDQSFMSYDTEEGSRGIGEMNLVNLLPPGAMSGQGGNPLGMLRFHPQFAEIQRIVQSNPALLQEILQKLGEESPDLIQLINENPEAFVQLLNEPISEDQNAMSPEQMQQFLSMMGGMGGEDENEDDDLLEGGEDGGAQDSIMLSDSDLEAVARLEALGFGRQTVIEAYLACDKNEMLAANLLLGDS